jgi:spermidine synthase
MAAVLLLVGFLSILAQVVLLRELAVSFFGSDPVFLLSISIWMIWTGVGALLGRWGRSEGPRAVATAFSLLGISIPLTVVLARGARILFRSTPGAYLPLERQAAALALTLAPCGLLLGYLFVRAARAHAARGGRFAAAYGIESAGSAIAGLASTALFAAGFSAIGASLGLGALSLFAASFFARMGPAFRFVCRVAGAAALALFLFLGRDLDRATLRWNFPFLLASRDSPYARVTVTGREGQVEIFESGALSYESGGTDDEELVHTALLQLDRVGSVLLVGGGATGAASEVRKHRPDSIEVIETDRVLLDVADEFLAGATGPARRAPGVRFVVEDGRRALRERRGPYDAVLVRMPEPEGGAANRFYTREFFADCARVLRPGGVLAFRLASAEQVWTAPLERRNGSVYRALASVFPGVVVLPGTSNVFLASDRPLSTDPGILARRHEERSLDARLIIPSYLAYLYTNDRFASVNRTLRCSTAPANSDGRPISYSFTVLRWLSRFHRPLAGVKTPGTAWFAAPLLFAGALLLLGRRSPAVSDLLAVALAGFAGIVVEFAILLRFQTASGLLYLSIGLLLAGFMAGLALGPIPGRRAAGVRGGGRLLLLALALHAALSALLFRWSGAGSLLVSLPWIACGGTVVGAVFSCAAEKGRAGGGALYAADLIGGSAGALIGTLLLLPVLGMELAVLWTAGAVLLGALFCL